MNDSLTNIINKRNGWTFDKTVKENWCILKLSQKYLISRYLKNSRYWKFIFIFLFFNKHAIQMCKLYD